MGNFEMEVQMGVSHDDEMSLAASELTDES
jgi:hypothetical protein